MESTADQIAAEAHRAFDLWRTEHDPEGEMNLLDAINAYSKWCEAGNRIALPDARKA